MIFLYTGAFIYDQERICIAEARLRRLQSQSRGLWSNVPNGLVDSGGHASEQTAVVRTQQRNPMQPDPYTLTRNIYQVSRHLRTFHRMWLIRNPLLGALCRHARPSPVEWRCDVPFFYSHIQYVECCRVPMQRCSGTIRTEKDLPALTKVKPLLDFSEATF